ncbi:MAG TPA: hypothetical protein VEA78_05125 [Acidimicrobiales bacterium]|nr:hypothetical protein [Acidimicrobiales bacterium]
MGEGDDDVDDGMFRLPLPPDDRLWRHPSELHGNQASFWWKLRHPWRVKAAPPVSANPFETSFLAGQPLSGDDGDAPA